MSPVNTASKASAKPKGTPRKSEEANPSVTFFLLVTAGVLVLAIGGMVWLASDSWVQGQKLWLISRASAISAFILLTIMVILGILTSHPANKQRWRLTRHLFPWHLALLPSLVALIALHLWFTATDPKSGITWSVLLFPLHARFHPIAMVIGAAALYLFVIVSMTASLRRWVKRTIWLPVHRASWLIWLFVLIHGLLGGTDAKDLHSLYWSSGLLVFFVFFWRHWVVPRQETAAVGTPLTVGKAAVAELAGSKKTMRVNLFKPRGRHARSRRTRR